jgi:pyruvate,water dikinase
VVGPLPETFEGIPELQPDEVVVCSSLLPSAVPWLVGCKGVVTDHGGRLSHGAILARELGIPAVLGTGVATRLVRAGDLVWLDTRGGRVIRLDKEPSAGVIDDALDGASEGAPGGSFSGSGDPRG